MNTTQHKTPLEDQKELEPHQDERQIRLDTDRSFLLYPVGDAPPHPYGGASLSLTSNPQMTVPKVTDSHAKQSSITLSFNYSDAAPV